MKEARKVRVVFDCAAKNDGESLNGKILQGPDLMNSIVGVLLSFREENIAMMLDVEAIFHQVYVHPKDLRAFHGFQVVIYLHSLMNTR